MRLFMMAGVCALAAAGFTQVWNEQGDAPDGPIPFQDTIGTGALTSIQGRIARGAGDHVDTYCIKIVDVQAFFATTKEFFGGDADEPSGLDADTRLWLWTAAGGILLGNDDVNDPALGTNDNFRSFISDPSTFTGFTNEVVDPSAQNISLSPGMFLLSISEFSNDPEDAVNADLVVLSPFDSLHGPNTAAGAFDHWENFADSTSFTYDIALQGVEFCNPVPEPATFAVLGLGAAALLRRRKK